ncbi:MAG: filamentous hemagglutinin N-terminal domain-containing protein, partial [Cyanobacteria bacterium J06636_16]
MGAECSRRSAIGLPGWVEGAIGVLGCGTLFAAPGLAQIVPDSSLGTESSVVTPDATVQGAPADLIEGGAVRGENLFHSFEDFNVNAGQRVYFANPLAIENILSRVTGSNLSNIEGLLGVDGGANLFLLNPNGVIFGPDAQLDISGSFTTGTANSFAFTDGSEFSAVPTGNELLSVSVPLGVQFNDSPQGDIENSGNLAVGAGETLTLFGNSVLSSGALTASGGTVQVLGNQVGLVDQAIIDVSGDTGGGTALIGGNYQGQGDLPTAQQTQVAPGVQITANTLEVGDGGTVIVWADGITEFAGSVAARGGLQGGNGGFVETSGRQTLIVALSAQVDASAFQGAGGLWFLDPSDITINEATATSVQNSLASGTNVELTTVGGTGGAGDITLASSINANATNNATLSLTASRSIAPAGNAVINISGGNLTLGLNQEIAPTTPTLNNALATIGTVSGNVTVNLGAGTYQEGAEVTLDRDITLNGA